MKSTFYGMEILAVGFGLGFFVALMSIGSVKQTTAQVEDNLLTQQAAPVSNSQCR